MATETTVHAHNSQFFEDLQLSAKDFYSTLKKMIADYKYPEVACTEVTLKEGGIFSSRRDYLKISKERYHFYVCASPFGKSFFISWWLKEDANTSANVAQRFGLFGKAVAQRLESKTFYEIDTQKMFVSSINSIVKVAVAKVMSEHGIRQPESIAG
ncbi:MAG: hypothetical protein ACHQHN_11715 [Sphingobacteriales bacterium]